MRAQASMEFILIFVLAFFVFIVALALGLNVILGFDNPSDDARLILETISIHASTIERITGPDDSATIRFTLPKTIDGVTYTIESQPIASDRSTVLIRDSEGNSLASTVTRELSVSIPTYDGEHELSVMPGGVMTLA